MDPHPLHEINLILRVDNPSPGIAGREHVFQSLYEFFYSAVRRRKDLTAMVDREKVMTAVRMLIEGIGEDPNREGLIDTPERVARMCEEMFGGLAEEPGEHLSRQFPAPDSELVVEKDIVFYSTCEHHLMPFFGKVHIAYIPGGKVAGLSKLPRTVEVFARRLQIQEQMTVQIADAVEHFLYPKGVMVVIEAEHTCMTMRGVKKPGAKAVTTATRGLFKGDFERQRLFLEMIRG